MKPKIKFNKSNKGKVNNIQTKVNLFPKLLFLIFAVVVLVGVAIYYNLSSTGQASQMGDFATFQTPQLSQNLNEKEGFQIDTKIVKDQLFSVSNSKDEQNDYKINFTLLEKGVVRYNLYKLIESEYVLGEFGLLNNVVGSTGGIFLDDDNVSDLRVDYKDGIVMVLNTNYVELEYSKIVMLNSSMGVVDDQVLFVKINQSVVYYFNVSSTKTPKVSVMWKGGANLSDSEFVINTSGEDFVIMKLMFTPNNDQPYVLLVNATVDDKSLITQYIFAAGNIIYVSDEEKSPGLLMRVDKDNNLQFNFTFRAVTGLQSFSLPCGSVDLSKIDTSNIAKVYGYNEGVQQWVENVPSDFETLISGKGYALKLKDKDKPLSFVGTCTSLQDVGFGPPTGLKEGWNLVGVYGELQDWSPSLLKKMPMPPGKSVKYVFMIDNVDQKLYEGNLQLGKAYWVKVE